MLTLTNDSYMHRCIQLGQNYSVKCFSEHAMQKESTKKKNCKELVMKVRKQVVVYQTIIRLEREILKQKFKNE